MIKYGRNLRELISLVGENVGAVGMLIFGEVHLFIVASVCSLTYGKLEPVRSVTYGIGLEAYLSE